MGIDFRVLRIKQSTSSCTKTLVAEIQVPEKSFGNQMMFDSQEESEEFLKKKGIDYKEKA